MPVDMSSEAITARFRKVDELRRLCLSLARAKPVDNSSGHGANSLSPEAPNTGVPAGESLRPPEA